MLTHRQATPDYLSPKKKGYCTCAHYHNLWLLVESCGSFALSDALSFLLWMSHDTVSYLVISCYHLLTPQNVTEIHRAFRVGSKFNWYQDLQNVARANAPYVWHVKEGLVVFCNLQEELFWIIWSLAWYRGARWADSWLICHAHNAHAPLGIFAQDGGHEAPPGVRAAVQKAWRSFLDTAALRSLIFFPFSSLSILWNLWILCHMRREGCGGQMLGNPAKLERSTKCSTIQRWVLAGMAATILCARRCEPPRGQWVRGATRQPTAATFTFATDIMENGWTHMKDDERWKMDAKEIVPYSSSQLQEKLVWPLCCSDYLKAYAWQPGAGRETAWSQCRTTKSRQTTP